MMQVMPPAQHPYNCMHWVVARRLSTRPVLAGEHEKEFRQHHQENDNQGEVLGCYSGHDKEGL